MSHHYSPLVGFLYSVPPTSFLLWGKGGVLQRSLEIKAGKVRESPELLPGARHRHLHSTSYWQCEGVHISPPLPGWHCSWRLWGVQFPCTALSLLCLFKNDGEYFPLKSVFSENYLNGWYILKWRIYFKVKKSAFLLMSLPMVICGYSENAMTWKECKDLLLSGWLFFSTDTCNECMHRD